VEKLFSPRPAGGVGEGVVVAVGTGAIVEVTVGVWVAGTTKELGKVLVTATMGDEIVAADPEAALPQAVNKTERMNTAIIIRRIFNSLPEKFFYLNSIFSAISRWDDFWMQWQVICGSSSTPA
jgi:hypothetical protein